MKHKLIPMTYTKEHAGKWLAVRNHKEVVAYASSLKALLKKLDKVEDREKLEIGPIGKHIFAG
ncbi:MAG: DUF5678 domain-containing protein [Candidatus Altimarinota bacterium]